MSGGSYDYLYASSDLAGQRHSIRRMKERLDQLATNGMEAAAVAALRTRMVEAHLERADALARGLTEVWHAVEWLDSGDSGEDRVALACADLEKGGPARGAGD